MKKHHIYFLLTIVVILCLSLSACTGKPQTLKNKPHWLDADHENYSSTSHLIGRSHYKYTHRAKEMAKDNLIETLSIKLTDKYSDFIYISQTINVGTEKLRNAIKIAETWKDPITDDVYVLAVINRQSAAKILTNEISHLDDLTRDKIEKATIDKNKFNKLSYAYQALNTQLKRNATEKAIYLAYPESKTIPFVWKQAKLDTDFKKLLNRMRIRPLVSHDKTGSLKKILTDAFKNIGIPIDNSPSADHVLQASLNITTKKSEFGLTSKAKLDITLVKKNGKKQGNHSWSLNILSANAENTAADIKQNLNEILNKELLNILLGFADTDK